MPFLVQIEQLHSPTVDCSRSTRMRNRTRPQWQPPSYVCSISLLPCRATLPGRLSFWGSSAHNPAHDKRNLHNRVVQNSTISVHRNHLRKRVVFERSNPSRKKQRRKWVKRL